MARAARAEMDLGFSSLRPSKLRSDLTRTISRGSSRVKPSNWAELSPQDDAATKDDAATRERTALRRLSVASKVAHQDLGERVAMFVGCALGLAQAEPSAFVAGKVLTLVVLEIATGFAKVAIFAASEIRVGTVRFNAHLSAFIAVAFAGACGCEGVNGGLRINCMIGDWLQAVLG